MNSIKYNENSSKLVSQITKKVRKHINPFRTEALQICLKKFILLITNKKCGLSISIVRKLQTIVELLKYFKKLI